MNDDHAMGSAKDTIGKGKELAGTATGNERLKAEGQADQAEGKIQKLVGDVKDALTGKDTH